jgi:hypothetical protein
MADTVDTKIDDIAAAVKYLSSDMDAIRTDLGKIVRLLEKIAGVSGEEAEAVEQAAPPTAGPSLQPVAPIAPAAAPAAAPQEPPPAAAE